MRCKITKNNVRHGNTGTGLSQTVFAIMVQYFSKDIGIAVTGNYSLCIVEDNFLCAECGFLIFPLMSVTTQIFVGGILLPKRIGY